VSQPERRTQGETHEPERRRQPAQRLQGGHGRQGENMTDILLEFIEEYVRKHTPAALKPAKKGR